MKIIEFYREGNQWYADVPEHTKEDNQMVLGADKFLDAVSLAACYNMNRILIAVSTDNASQEFMAKLVRKKHDEEGATYVVTGKLAKDMGFEGAELWLCNVAHTVLGEHPESIYIHDILDSPDLSKEIDRKVKGHAILRRMGLEMPEKNPRRYNDEEYQKLEKMYEIAYWQLHGYVS